MANHPSLKYILHRSRIHRASYRPAIHDAYIQDLSSLEPVFSAGFAFVFTGETLTGKGYLGATLILLSVLIAELDFKSLLRSNYKKNIE